MSTVTIDDLRDRRLIPLGSNPFVNLTVAATYPIFTTGVLPNLASTGRTVVYVVTVTPNTGNRQKWDAGTCTFSIDGGAWAVSQELKNFDVPASIFSQIVADNPATRGPAYPNAYVFNFNLTAGNANNGMATVTAWGWAR